MTEFKVAHLTTVDLSLRFLVRPQLLAVVDAGGEAIGISAPGPWVESLAGDGIRHVPLTASTRGMSLGSDIAAATQLWRVLRRERFTVLHTHNPKPGLYGRVLGRLAGVPLVINTMHGFYATEDDPIMKRALVYSLEAIAARTSDIELHQNPEDLKLARRLSILPKGKGSLLGNGVDLVRFDPKRVDGSARSRLRADLGISDDQVVVGMVGRLVAEKGYPELFEAFAYLGDEYRLVVVGPDDPDKPDALPRETVAKAEAGGVLFLGMRTDVEEVYTAFDLFVLPSHREGFPRAAMEAASMGLPVVATNIRGCRQVVDDGVNGLLVSVNDASALRNAIQRLGDDPMLRTEMGIASRRIALERFDERRVVEIVMDSYRRGLTDKGLGHLLPASLVGDSDLRPFRTAIGTDIGDVAGLHGTEIKTGLVTRLGSRFARLFYGSLIAWPGSVVVVVEDQAGTVGFAAGVTNRRDFLRWFVRRHWFHALLASGPRLISSLGQTMDALRLVIRDQDDWPEFMSMAVAERAVGKGVSKVLGKALLEALADEGCDEVYAFVESDDVRANRALESLGFSGSTNRSPHRGEGLVGLVWRT